MSASVASPLNENPPPDIRNTSVLVKMDSNPNLSDSAISDGHSMSYMHKNRLQQFAQRSGIGLPVYQTSNEGFQHAPKFKSIVIVDGTCYQSPNTFPQRKAAEQDVARIALLATLEKIKNEGTLFIRGDHVFCKSILVEYAVKMKLEKPTYSTTAIPSKLSVPVFASTLVFHGVSYFGDIGKNKKEAEQLAARVAVLSLLASESGDPESGTAISEIIKSKLKVYAALNELNGIRGWNDALSMITSSVNVDVGAPPSDFGEGTIASTAGNANFPASMSPKPCVQLVNVATTNEPSPVSKKPRVGPSLDSSSPHALIPQALEMPPAVASSSRKRNNKKKKAKKKEQVNPPLRVHVLPSIGNSSLLGVQ